MALKLLERSYVKDLANIARADTLYDPTINGMIEQASLDVEKICRRKFTKIERTEFYQSYDQTMDDPDPQFLWLNAFPVDDQENLVLKWDPWERHDETGVTLTQADKDFTLDVDEGLIVVRSASGLTKTISSVAMGSSIFTYAMRGFRLTYTGGYAITAGTNEDPLDDYGVVQIPEGLKIIMARKIARDFLNALPPDGTSVQRGTAQALPRSVGALGVWDIEDIRSLKPYTKKDIMT